MVTRWEVLRLGACRAYFLILITSICLLGWEARADYVETAPRPGAPLPPAIPPGECPLNFLQGDIQHARQAACSSVKDYHPPPQDVTTLLLLLGASTIPTASSLPTTCCGQLQAVLFQARVRYANETGRLLLPQESADACIQTLNQSLVAAGMPFLENCRITSAILSEETGKACGPDLMTVFDFWSATNRTFPGTLVATCFGSHADCGLCTTLITNKILGLGKSTTDVLSTTSCQDLAKVAMTAAAYPLVAANALSQCLYVVDIAPVPRAPKCTAYNWKSANYTSVVRSCGTERYRADRCCNLILAMINQGGALYLNRTGVWMNPGEADVCWTEFRQELLSHGVLETVLDTCPLTASIFLFNVGCYNYTTIYQRAPSSYYPELEQSCNSGANCSNCRPALTDVGLKLANSTSTEYVNLCTIMFGLQYYAAYGSTIRENTDKLNCYYQFPPGLELGLPYPPEKSHPNVGLIAGVCAAAVAALFALVLVVYLLRKRFPGHKARWNTQLRTLSRLSSLQLKASEQRLQVYSRKQLVKATGNFDSARLLGTGGTGMVYVGDLNGEAVAVKEVVLGSAEKGAKEAWNELATLAQYRSRNLVILKGCCFSGPHCSLIYEFMEQGSLADHLFPPEDASESTSQHGLFLDWPTRQKIAVGAAKGLAHLHDECKPRCIHRDVKPSNILLTSEFEAKLSDFGLARRTRPEDTHVTTAVAGTWGYLSPEYIATGQLTEKSDVYSFGVVLLTLLSGRRPTKRDAQSEEAYLPEWAWVLEERNELWRLIDPRLEGDRTEHAESMERMTRIALLCVHTVGGIRPTMRQCVDMLSNRLKVPPLPTRPMTLYTIASMASSDTGSASMARALQLGTSEGGIQV